MPLLASAGLGGLLSKTSVLPPDAVNYHPAAQSWFAAVESNNSAMGENPAATLNNKQAFSNWFSEMDSLGYLQKLKLVNFFAGISTLQGSLIPAIGSNQFESLGITSSDYSPSTGLTSINGYLQSDRKGSDDPRNDMHFAIWNHSVCTEDSYWMWLAGGGSSDGAKQLLRFNGRIVRRISSSTNDRIDGNFSAGFVGASRANENTFIYRNGGVTEAKARSSQPSSDDKWNLFSNNFGYANGSIKFVSAGLYVDLTLLDQSLTNLFGALT